MLFYIAQEINMKLILLHCIVILYCYFILLFYVVVLCCTLLFYVIQGVDIMSKRPSIIIYNKSDKPDNIVIKQNYLIENCLEIQEQLLGL